eukprot:966070_1
MENKSQKHIVVANRDYDAKNENEVPVLCPNDHALSQFQAPNYDFSCDGCEQMILLSAPLYGCRTCNYDLCTTCYKSKSYPIQPIEQKQNEENEHDFRLKKSKSITQDNEGGTQ